MNYSGFLLYSQKKPDNLFVSLDNFVVNNLEWFFEWFFEWLQKFGQCEFLFIYLLIICSCNLFQISRRIQLQNYQIASRIRGRANTWKITFIIEMSRSAQFGI